MGGQTSNRSGANLKGDAGLLDGGLSVPTQSGVANFARRTGQVSADLLGSEIRLTGRPGVDRLQLGPYVCCRPSTRVEVKMICSARPHHRRAAWSLSCAW